MEIDKPVFRFQYLPDYAKFLLSDKLEEFVTVGIRFYREESLPMMRPLSRLSEAELLRLTIESNRRLLQALSENNVADFIERNLSNFLSNNLIDGAGRKLLENTEIVAEDIILAFYLRRKLFGFFLYSYTQNTAIHMLIMNEVDYYTTKEHLLTTKAYLNLLQEQTRMPEGQPSVN